MTDKRRKPHHNKKVKNKSLKKKALVADKKAKTTSKSKGKKSKTKTINININMNSINKAEARKQLEALKADVARLETIINTPMDVFSVTTMKQIFEESGTTEEQFLKECAGLRKHEIGARKVEMICAFFNQGGEADFDDENVEKFCLWFRGGKKNFRLDCVRGRYGSVDSTPSWSFLKTRKLGEHIGKYFVPEYKEWLIKE